MLREIIQYQYFALSKFFVKISAREISHFRRYACRISRRSAIMHDIKSSGVEIKQIFVVQCRFAINLKIAN